MEFYSQVNKIQGLVYFALKSSPKFQKNGIVICDDCYAIKKAILLGWLFILVIKVKLIQEFVKCDGYKVHGSNGWVTPSLTIATVQ